MSGLVSDSSTCKLLSGTKNKLGGGFAYLGNCGISSAPVYLPVYHLMDGPFFVVQESQGNSSCPEIVKF